MKNLIFFFLLPCVPMAWAQSKTYSETKTIYTYKTTLKIGEFSINPKHTIVTTVAGDSLIFEERLAGVLEEKHIISRSNKRPFYRTMKILPHKLESIFGEERITGTVNLNQSLTHFDLETPKGLWPDGMAGILLFANKASAGYKASYKTLDPRYGELDDQVFEIFSEKEMITVPAGTFEAWKGVATYDKYPDRKTVVWIDSQSRNLVRFEIFSNEGNQKTHTICELVKVER